MAVLEGKWDCSQCRKIGISGLQTECPRCKDSRNQQIDPDEAPYLPNDARVITDDAELNYAKSGPSWNCGKCGRLNLGNATHCSELQCGEPRDQDDRVNPVYTYVEGVDADGVFFDGDNRNRVVEDDWVEATLQSADPLQAVADGPVATPSRTFRASELPRQGPLGVRDAARKSSRPAIEPSRFNLKRALAGLVALIILLVGVGVVYVNFFQTHDVALEVTSLSWERQVEVEALRTLTEEGWDHPGDARVLSSRQEIHHYDTVLDHYETRTREVPETVPDGSHTEEYACGSTTVDNGNGTFTQETTYCERTVQDYRTEYRTESYEEAIYREDPVYEMYYRYEIDRWLTERFERASGTQDPYWPEPKNLSPYQRVGDERRDSYDVALVDPDGRKFDRSVEFDTWTLLEIGGEVSGKQNARGSLHSVQWPAS